MKYRSEDLSKFISEETAKSWGEVKDILAGCSDTGAAGSSRWIFRGQANAGWPLSSRLEREFERFGIEGDDRYSWEFRLVREFKRHYSRFRHTDPESIVEWLSIMQHFGAPTRLMDWTYSSWAALTFAVEDAHPCTPSAVWALAFDWFHEQIDGTLPEKIARMSHDDRNHPANLRSVFDQNRRPGLFFLNPFKIHERLAIQQGVFVTTRDIAGSFAENALATLETSGPEKTKEYFLKVILDLSRSGLKEVLSELQRLNVTRRSLFPGFEGFAGDLHNLMGMAHLFKGVDQTSIWLDE